MTIGDQPTTIRMVLHISELMISVDSDDQFSQCLGFFPGQKVKDSLQVIGEGFLTWRKNLLWFASRRSGLNSMVHPSIFSMKGLGNFGDSSDPATLRLVRRRNIPTSTVVFMGFGRILGMKGNREGAGKHHLIIDFNENRVISGFSNFNRWMSLMRLIRCCGPGDSNSRSMMSSVPPRTWEFQLKSSIGVCPW